MTGTEPDLSPLPSLVIGTGWAVMASNDQVDLRTVGETRRSAIVNWLYTAGGIFVANYWTDENIESAWSQLAPRRGVQVVEVNICLKEGS